MLPGVTRVHTDQHTSDAQPEGCVAGHQQHYSSQLCRSHAQQSAQQALFYFMEMSPPKCRHKVLRGGHSFINSSQLENCGSERADWSGRECNKHAVMQSSVSCVQRRDPWPHPNNARVPLATYKQGASAAGFIQTMHKWRQRMFGSQGCWKLWCS